MALVFFYLNTYSYSFIIIVHIIKEYDAHFFELSNRDTSNVFQAIEEIAKVLLKNIVDDKNKENSIKPKETENRNKKKCC